MKDHLNQPSPIRPPELESTQYAAFLAYSTDDRREAIRLQRDLERFRIPRNLVGTIGRYGLVPKRLGKVFLDRTDLSAAQDITLEITAALARSRTLIVLCSNSAADPKRWVGREILAYRSLRPAAKIFAVILRDDPPLCFPEELYSGAAADESPCIENTRLVPLAADMRRQGDGRRDALVKLVAGILGVDFDILRRQRARAEQRRRFALVAIGFTYALTISMALIGVVYTSVQLLSSRNAAIAEQAKSANETGRTDLALLLAATALPVRPSIFEHILPSAEAQAVRALLASRVDSMISSGGAIVSEWDPIRKRAYLARFGGKLAALDLAREQAVPMWNTRFSGVTAIALSIDGKLLAVATDNGSLSILDTNTGNIESVSEAVGRDHQGRSLGFSPVGDKVVMGRQDGTAQIWSVHDHRWTVSAPRQGNWPVTGVAFSNDGQSILSASNPKIMEWEANTGRLISEREVGTVSSITALEGGLAWAVTYSLAPQISVLYPRAMRPDKILQISHPAVRARLSVDGQTLVASSWDGNSAILIDYISGQSQATLRHPEWVDDAAVFSADGRVVTLSRDGFIRIWKNPLRGQGSRYQVLPGGGPSVIALAGADHLYIGGGGPAITELDMANSGFHTLARLSCVDIYNASSKCWMVGLHVFRDGGDLLYTVRDGRIGRIDTVSGRTKWEISLGTDIVGSTMTPDQRYISILIGNGTVSRVAVDSGGLVDPLNQSDTSDIQLSQGRLAFSPSGEVLAETNEKGLTIRRAENMEVLWQAPVYDRIAISAAWLPSGNTVIAGTAGDSVQVFSVSGGPASRILRGHTSWVLSVAASPSGRYIASVANNEAIVWDVVAGETVLTIPYHGLGGFSDITFSKDGKRLAIADSAGGVRVVSFDVPESGLYAQLCSALPEQAKRFTTAQMREFHFLRTIDLAPCERPELFSLAHLSLMIRAILDDISQ